MKTYDETIEKVANKMLLKYLDGDNHYHTQAFNTAVIISFIYEIKIPKVRNDIFTIFNKKRGLK